MSCPSNVLFVEKTARSGKSWGLYVGGFWKLCFDPQKGATNKDRRRVQAYGGLPLCDPPWAYCCFIKRKVRRMKIYKIAVAGTGYVGLSLSVLLAQHNQVMAVDIVQAKVDMINNHKSPIQDDYIEKYLAEKELNLTATLDAKAAYSDADFVVIAAPTNVYPKFSVAFS